MVAIKGDELDYLSLVARYLKELGSQRPPTTFGAGYVFLGYQGTEIVKISTPRRQPSKCKPTACKPSKQVQDQGMRWKLKNTLIRNALML